MEWEAEANRLQAELDGLRLTTAKTTTALESQVGQCEARLADKDVALQAAADASAAAKRETAKVAEGVRRLESTVAQARAETQEARAAGERAQAAATAELLAAQREVDELRLGAVRADALQNALDKMTEQLQAAAAEYGELHAAHKQTAGGLEGQVGAVGAVAQHPRPAVPAAE